MASNVLLTIASYVSSSQSSIYLSGTRQIAPSLTNLTWATDANSQTYLDLAYDGTTAFSQGTVLCEMSNPSLSSGQAIACIFCRPYTDPFNVEIPSSYLTAELIVQAVVPSVGTETILYQNPDGIGPFYNVDLAPVGRASGSDWRTDINNLRVQFNGYRRASASTNHLFWISKFSVGLSVYNRPTLTVTGPSPIAGATVSTTSRPTITWTFSGDTLTQSHYRVRIFSAAQYGAGGFNPQTSTATVDTDWVASSNEFFTPSTALTNGTTYRAYVMAAQTLPVSLYRHETVDGTTLATLGSTQYSQFTISFAAPPVPTGIQPTTGSTITTDRPTLRATLGASTVSGGVTVGCQWQMATDAAFTANVRTLTQDASEYVTSGAVSKVCDAAAELFQGTWYIRAREIDSLGGTGNYSASQTFTVAHTPSALTVSPTGQASRPTGNVSFSFSFSDPSPTDSQSAYQIIVETNAGVGILDTGKQVSTATSHTASITGYNDQLLRWKVRVYDSDNVVSAYSSTSQFYVRSLPTITAGSPTTGSTLTTPNPTYTFTCNRTISQYRFLTVQTSTGITRDDSGWITGSTASYTPTTALLNSTGYTLSMQVRDSYSLENSLSVTFTTLWNAPANPTPTVTQTNFESTGAISVSWTQNRDASFIGYRVYAKKTTDTTYTQLAETVVSTGSTYTVSVSAVPANVPIHLAVTQLAYRYGVPVESQQSPITVTLAGSSYYLVGSTTNVKLSNVKDDSFKDEWEQEEIRLIGRGRRVEKGTRYGIRGRLQAVVYDDGGIPASTHRANLEALRSTDSTCYLRTPFGDIWKVGLGDIEIGRIAGVGTNQYFTVSIDYFEVSST